VPEIPVGDTPPHTHWPKLIPCSFLSTCTLFGNAIETCLLFVRLFVCLPVSLAVCLLGALMLIFFVSTLTDNLATRLRIRSLQSLAFFLSHLISFLDQELIPYRYSSCSSCCWGDLFKKAQGSVVSSRIGMKFGRIVPRVNVHRLSGVGFRT